MELSSFTKQFFEKECFSEPFPGYDSCLTGYGISSVVGVSPWETKRDLLNRLMHKRKRFEYTFEMKRGSVWKESVFMAFSEVSKAYPIRRNPMQNNSLLYLNYKRIPGCGCLADGFLVNRESERVVAGMTVRTSGLSNDRYWGKHLQPIHAAPALFCAGVSGLDFWVIATMMFEPDPDDDGRESIPKEIRCYRVVVDHALFSDIAKKAEDFCNENFISKVALTDESDEIAKRIEEFCETHTKLYNTIVFKKEKKEDE